MRFLISLLLIPAAYALGGWYCVAGYLAASVPFAWIVARLVKGIDLRDYGSGNPGAGQVLRLLGPFWFGVSLLLDAAKGVPVLRWSLGHHLSLGAFGQHIVDSFGWTDSTQVIGIALIALFGILGHLYSIWLKGRGGKGAATALGVLVALSPVTALIVLIVWIISVVVSKTISIGTLWGIATAIACQGIELPLEPSPQVKILLCVIALIVALKHIPNMIRLSKGTERKIGDPEPEPEPAIPMMTFIVHGESDNPSYYKWKIIKKFWLLAPILIFIPSKWILAIMRKMVVFKYASIKNVTSMATGRKANGVVMGIPWTADELKADEEFAFEAIRTAIEKAMLKYNAVLADLGAHTAIVCENGKRIAEHMKNKIPVVTGNVLTTIVAVKSLLKAARLAGFDLSQVTLTIIGGSGSIGKAAAKYLLAKTNIKHIILVARDQIGLIKACAELNSERVSWNCDLRTALGRSHLVVCAVGSTEIEVGSRWFRPGTIIVEISRPRVLGEKISQYRSDVLVIAGGMCVLPGKIVSSFNLGYRSNEFLACVSEGLLRLLVGPKAMKPSYGKDFTYEELVEMEDWADDHGFTIGRFRPCDDKSFDPKQLNAYRRARENVLGRPLAGFDSTNFVISERGDVHAKAA